MSKYKFENLSPFKFFLLETFPFIQQEYFDAMNEWQMFCKVGEKINEIINSQNKVGEETEKLNNNFIALKEYVDNYFDDLDLDEEISEKLNDLVEDGTMERLINQEIFGELNENVEQNTEKIDFIKKFPTTKIGLNRIFRFLEDSNYLSMQGGALTNNNTLICAMWDSSNDTNKFIEISLATGQILKQEEFSFGYCNGLTFDNIHNLIYVAHRGSEAEPNKKLVSILNYEDLSLVTTMTFSDYVMSCSYDKVSNKLYYLNEWGLRNNYGFKLYEINQTSYQIENEIELDFSDIDVNKLRIQNFCVVNDYIYVISSEPRALLVFDMEGNLKQKYNLPEYINKIYYSGEYQFVDYLNGDLFVGSGDVVGGDIESINQVFKITLDEDFIDGNQNENTVHAGSSYTVYVDSSSTSINPDGSENNKFKSINEATRCETTNRGCNINIADGTYHGVYLRSRDHIKFEGNSQNVIIKGFNINYCTHVVINNATIQDCEFSQNGVINILNSTIYLKNCDINDDDEKYGVYIGDFSECNFSYGVNIITNNLNQIYIRNDSLLINNGYDYTVQKHQKHSKIIGEGKVKLFQNPSQMCVGEFTIDESWNYTNYEFYKFFKEMKVAWHIGNNNFITVAPLVNTKAQTWIQYQNTSGGSGSQKTSQVQLDFNENKLRLQYSRVYTRNASGVSTAEVNNDNDNPVNDSIIIDNIYFE